MTRERAKEVLFWIVVLVALAVICANEMQQSRQMADVQATTDRIEDRFTVHERTPTPGIIPAPRSA